MRKKNRSTASMSQKKINSKMILTKKKDRVVMRAEAAVRAAALVAVKTKRMKKKKMVALIYLPERCQAMMLTNHLKRSCKCKVS